MTPEDQKPEDVTSEAPATEAETADQGEHSTNDTPEGAAALEAAEAKAKEHWEAYLRASAELENVRRRAERDVANAHKFGLEKFASELLGVRDSLELGLASSQAESATVETVREGMELTLKQLSTVMDKFGIKQVDPTGLPFNPEQHEAVAMVEADADPNTVVNVMQRGYLLNDRLLRAAMVTVARPQPKTDD
ncbi:MAG: nucleotide exchange factor GrpE [Abyssibacter sp.]|uniref:nucleotide exchange factor GrpE n=1 Tax=Abyssibacter sp. TaxID=2320200 RepID=UPI002EB9133A|nr:nucleotide exchange factor GrpE [Pseudomonadota bacterium]